MRKHLFVLGLALVSITKVSAGTYSTDFNFGTPANLTLFGNAVVATNGGFTNSGVLKLTTAAASQSGSCVIGDIDGGQPVLGLRAAFKALVGGGTAADGFSFNFASDLPSGGFSEEGAGTGLTVSFDTFVNTTSGETTPTIDVKYGGNVIASAVVTAAFIRQNAFVDVVINLKPNGSIDVIYDGVTVHANVPTGYAPISGGLYGFGARTGGQTDNHFIDNLTITTQTNAAAFVDTYAPQGRGVRPDAIVSVALQDNTTLVQTNTLQLFFDGTNVTSSATINQSTPTTTITYDPPGLLASSSAHNVSVSFSDDASPTPTSTTVQWDFNVPAYASLPTNLLASPALVDTNAPGFVVRFAQVADNNQPGSLKRAEQQLAAMIIDPLTGAPMANTANPDSVAYPANVVATNVTSYTYVETNVLNYAGGGNFGNDFTMPGLPGTGSDSHNYALDAVAYLRLAPGYYTLGVNSADGCKLTVASTPDTLAPVEAVFDGPRLTPADSLVTFAVTQDGYYPFRVLYMIAQHAMQGVPLPGTDTPSLEFFSVDANGVKTLINDTAVTGYISAYRPTTTLPYIRSVDPESGETGVSRSAPIDIVLVDGGITVQTNSIQIKLNGVDVTASSGISTVITNNENLTLLHYQPPTPLAVNTTNLVQIAFTDSASARRTNVYTFTTENILSPLWIISPTQSTNTTWQKWVTTGSTERGIAYNPKTGHVLLVARGSGTGADGPNGNGIAVLDGNTGLYLKQLAPPVGGYPGTSALGGNFRINLVDVADDGVIYVCNLSVNSTQHFRIYRWQNEDDTNPTVAYDSLPIAAGGTPRWGDVFCVRNSGAGTQLVSSGNNASVNSIPVFTTVDGTNFTVTLVVAAGMPNNGMRLGLAFGCGNSLYGKDNATTGKMQYCSFVGAPSTAGAQIAAYNIVDVFGNQGIGPIGIDVANQRLMGDATIGGSVPHSLSLFDIDQLSTTAVNSPIDSKSYATSAGSFGTGAVDFSPDGTRVYALDSGNGIIAFSLAPKLAAPTICSQPVDFVKTNLVGGIAFFGVQPIGAPLSYQWRKNGTPLSGATSRTLDIYNAQTNDFGLYSVVVTNSMGSVTSSNVLLDEVITFSTPPSDQITPIGGSATFSVVAAGGLPGFTYQWKKNGSNLGGATNASLTITNAQQSNAGGYTVAVTDSLGQTVLSPVASLTVGTLGSGTGLLGQYYSGQINFAGSPVLTRIDPTVDFSFGTGSPDASISSDLFAVRWTGKVQPLYSETYTFYVTSDDGSRLWVNGQKLIDKWLNQPPTESSGTIALTSGQQYDVVLEYYENAGGATASMSWSSAGQVKQIIPQTQLYPGSATLDPAHPAVTASSGPGGVALSWSGSYVLQSATNVAGPYADVPGATSPYTNDISTDPMKFFRLLSE